MRGRRLAIDHAFRPVAVVNGELAEVMSSGDSEMTIRLGDEHRFGDTNEVIVTFDPFAVVKMDVKA